MPLVIFCVLLPLLLSAPITLNSTTQLDIQLTHSTPIQNTTNTDACYRLEVASSSLYHLSSENYYEVWALSNLGAA